MLFLLHPSSFQVYRGHLWTPIRLPQLVVRKSFFAGDPKEFPRFPARFSERFYSRCLSSESVRFRLTCGQVIVLTEF